MEESVTYQKIIRKGEALGEARGEVRGKIEEARKLLLLQGRSRFGEPPPEALAALAAFTDVSELEELGVRLLRASSWQELLGSNGASRHDPSGG
jgi:predicted transposase YdaD